MFLASLRLQTAPQRVAMVELYQWKQPWSDEALDANTHYELALAGSNDEGAVRQVHR